MDKDFIKELLSTYRLNKNMLWNSLIVSLGGVIGLLFNISHTKNNKLEIVFLVIGVLLSAILTFSISVIDDKITKLLQQLKGVTPHE